MLGRYAAERGEFERNLQELKEMQARLQALTVRAACHHGPAEGAGSVERPRGASALPVEVVGRALWHLDFSTLARMSCLCREWAELAKSKARWQALCESDWGVVGAGTWQDYRQRLARWRAMRATLAGLKGSGCPSGICGSLARRRLFEALEALAEIGTAPNAAARYPAQVPRLMRATGAGHTLLALLEDESPHLLCLAVRCLADLAADELERPALRAEIVQRGPLIRGLLEGEDSDVVEAAARMMLNLHGAPGTPLRARRRGPAAFALNTSAASATPWSGAWAGEMRYARGGERHAAFRLVLGTEGDPAVERVSVALRAAEAGVAARQQADGIADDGTSRRQAMRAEGGAEYWHYFGFLAASDFDCAKESVRYLEEQIRRRRLPSSPTHTGPLPPPRPKALTLVGAGWDEQNGWFTVEAPVPTPAALPSGTSTPAPCMANAVPLRLTLQYERNHTTYELTGFLADGTDSSPGTEPVQALYGVWATAPSQHRHLFVLRRVAPLADALEYGGDSHCLWHRVYPLECWGLINFFLDHTVPKLHGNAALESTRSLLRTEAVCPELVLSLS